MNINNNEIKDGENDFLQVIHKCLELSKGGNYIFRGTNQEHARDTNRIESSLHRQLEIMNHIHIVQDLYEEDKRITECAKHLFPPNTADVEILTELRHYGEDLCIIDFTKNLFIALFFACQKTFDDQERITEKHGEIILMKMPNPKTDSDNPPKLPYAVVPATNHSSNKRVLAQSSIFVHAPNGFIENQSPHKFNMVRVDFKFKEKISNYLKNFHNINSNTVFGDVLGFIKDKSNVGLNDLELGMRSFRVRKLEESIHYLTKFINSKKVRRVDVHDALIYRALTWIELKEFDKSIADSSKALKIYQRNKSGLFTRGIAKFKKSDNAGALADMNKYIETNSHTRGAYMWRAQIYISSKEFENALSALNIFLQIAPESKEAIRLHELLTRSLSNSGEINLKHEEFEGVESLCNQARLTNKFTYSSKKMQINLIKILDKEIKSDPENTLTLMNRGEAKFHLKKFNEAIIDFDAAIKLLNSKGDDSSPNLLVAFHLRGISNMNCLNYESAIEDFNKALKVYPINPVVMTDRATAFYAKGKQAEKEDNVIEASNFFKIALTELTVAITLNPELIYAFYNRQLVHYALGKYRKAREDFGEINRLNAKALCGRSVKKETN